MSAPASLQEPATDGAGLSKFQLRILAVLADERRYGLAIKSELEAYYGEDVNHGRLYPNLSDLADEGLVQIREKDKRTNEYVLTGAGEAVLAQELDWVLGQLGVPEEQARGLSIDTDTTAGPGGDRR